MLVSVLINNYNYGAFLDECISSVLNQTYKNFEIILYDDGSADNSLEIARKYETVKIISNSNFGKKPSFNQGNAINTAFGISNGDVICLLDSDDYFSPRKLEMVITTFKENKNAVLVQNAAQEFTDNKLGAVHNYSVIGADYKKLYYKKRWTAFFNPTSCLSFRREYLLKVLPLAVDEYWRVWADVRLSRIAPFYGDIINLPDCLTYYRKHQKNDSSNMNRNDVNTLRNQRDHHLYINNEILKIKECEINFYSSFNFFKFLVKVIIPARLFKRK